MEQSPTWEANSHSANQEIPRFLCNPKVYDRVHKAPPLVPIPIQMNPVYNFPPYVPKIHCDIFPSMPRSSSYLFSLDFPTNIVSLACVLHVQFILFRFFQCTACNQALKERKPHYGNKASYVSMFLLEAVKKPQTDYVEVYYSYAPELPPGSRLPVL